jgi:tellurite methyltransferase
VSNDRQRWEERYARRAHTGAQADAWGARDLGAAAAQTPSAFVVAHALRFKGCVLDVAAGAGRNALYLASVGNTVELFDIALGGLRVAMQTAQARGLRLDAVQADLETYPLPVARYDAAINIRYLQRSLFPTLQRAVKPGGMILFETFLVGQQEYGHPRNPAFLLQPGELPRAFCNCDVLVYEEGLFEDCGSPAYLARMLARRRD